MNKTQKNFKREISRSLYIEEKKARKGKGAFSNNLFSLRFYGYNGSSDNTYRPVIIRLFSFIIKLVLLILKLVFLLAVLLVIVILVYAIKNNLNG